VKAELAKTGLADAENWIFASARLRGDQTPLGAPINALASPSPIAVSAGRAAQPPPMVKDISVPLRDAVGVRELVQAESASPSSYGLHIVVGTEASHAKARISYITGN
jgi:hypothetical protein